MCENYLIKNTLISSAILMCCYSSSAFSITPEELEKLRDELKADVSHSQVGSAYGHIISFVSEPDIAASNLDIDDGDDKSTLDILKIPLQYKLDTGTDAYALTLRANLNYASYKEDDVLPVPEGEQIDSEWEAYSGSIGTAVEIPLAAGFSFAPAIDVGIARFENKAKYKGNVSNAIIKPIVKDILLDWDTNAGFVSAVLGLNYKYIFKQYDLDIRSRYSHTYIDSFSESKDFVGFTDNTDTVTVNADFTHPLDMTVGGYPLSGVAHLDYTKFIGPNRDIMGFSALSGIGYSIRADVSKREWHVESLQLGAKYLTGNNVRGWSIVLGYQF